MDRVPLRFIEEVLLLLDSIPYWIRKTLHYPSTWGKVAARRGVKEQVRVNVYLSQEPVFSLWTSHAGTNMPVPLEDLEQFVIRDIFIYKENRVWREERHPLNKKNFQLLQRHLRRGYPCYLALHANFSGISYLEQLCLAPSRVTHFSFDGLDPFDLPLPTEILTQNIDRGALRCLVCSNGVHVTNEFFPVILRFVASEQFEHLMFASSSGPVSSKVFLEGAIDAFLSRPRRKQFWFVISERYRDICGRLMGEDVREEVGVEFRRTRTLLSVCPAQ
uniref:Glycosyltransferase family 1 protein n=1 Tax=Steinernema glaseri TaxID=37863 RepID=A0A1I7YXB7_9BILA